MSTTSFVPSLGIGSTCRRQQTRILNPGRIISKPQAFHFLGNQSFQSLCNGSGLRYGTSTIKRFDMAICSSFQPDLPPDASPGSWNIWIVGMLLSAILPFFGSKWGPLLKLRKEVETVIETAEHVTDMVENVAEGVEKVADEIADHLPSGKLKNAFVFVENIAKEAAKDARLAEQLIDKVEEVEREVLESFNEAAATQEASEITEEATDQSKNQK